MLDTYKLFDVEHDECGYLILRVWLGREPSCLELNADFSMLMFSE